MELKQAKEETLNKLMAVCLGEWTHIEKTLASESLARKNYFWVPKTRTTH